MFALSWWNGQLKPNSCGLQCFLLLKTVELTQKRTEFVENVPHCKEIKTVTALFFVFWNHSSEHRDALRLGQTRRSFGPNMFYHTVRLAAQQFGLVALRLLSFHLVLNTWLLMLRRWVMYESKLGKNKWISNHLVDQRSGMNFCSWNTSQDYWGHGWKSWTFMIII